MNKITQTAQLAKITNYPQQPVELFKHVLERVKATSFTMNLATLDNEFGVLNRTVMYRGLLDDSICFVTERNSRKYRNLKENPKLSLTMLFVCGDKQEDDGGDEQLLAENWQIRLFNAEAVELNDLQLKTLWQDEPLFAKIRSHICECGKPREPKELAARFEQVLQVMQKENKEPEQTSTYTAFKIIPKLWDFYKSEPDKIADRVQYKQLEDGQWESYHVDA